MEVGEHRARKAVGRQLVPCLEVQGGGHGKGLEWHAWVMSWRALIRQ